MKAVFVDILQNVSSKYSKYGQEKVSVKHDRELIKL